MLQVLPRERHQGRAARRRHLALRRRAAGRGRDRHRRRQDEPRARDRLSRTASSRVEAGITNLGITDAVAERRLLLRARSVEPARLHDRRQHRHEFRRRPLPEIRRHHQQRARRQDRADGRRRSSRSAARISMSPGYDLLGLIVGSEGQLGIVTEATVRILRAAEGARPMLIGFDSSEAAGALRRRHHRAPASFRSPSSIMDRPAIDVCEAFAKAGYPLDVEALLIIEVEGSEDEIADLLGAHRRASPQRVRARRSCAVSSAGRAERAHLEGPQVRVRRHRPHLRLLLHGRHHPARPAAATC